MKRLISAFLCLLLAITMLVSCGEDPIGEFLEEYDYVPTEIEEISLNFYIVCDDASTENAKETVKQRIEQYTLDKYHTAVKVTFVSEDMYEPIALSKATEGAKDRADIILVNSKSLMDQLIEKNRLVDLTDFYSSKEYGKLNVQIASDLLEASAIPVEDEDGVISNRYFCVPNNHVVGEYEYIAIDKAVARHYYFSDETLSTYTDYSALGEENLWLALEYAGENPADHIKVVTCGKDDVQQLESENYFRLINKVENTAGEGEPDNSQYTYLVVNKELSKQYGYTKEDFDAYESVEDYVEFAEAQKANLWHAIKADGGNPADSIKIVGGMYEDKAVIESEGYYCNIMSYPTATAEEAFSSAFAVVNGTEYAARAMEIIYALNNDIELRNLLLYGVKDTNFTLKSVNIGTEENPVYVNYAVRVDEGESVYYMDLGYTGNIFNAYYCEAIGWTHIAAKNGQTQNYESNDN